MSEIVVLGGGKIEEKETVPLDRKIVDTAENNNPRALYVPTAGGESEKYIDVFKEVYGEELGCETDVLYLLDKEWEEQDLREKVLSADLIYVGGGNTRRMMNVWRDRGMDEILREAYENDIVLSGLSAGGICWFESGHSDSQSFETEGEDWEYQEVEGVGLIRGIHCPHYNKEDRREDFLEFMKGEDRMGIAIEDLCGMVFREETAEVLNMESGGSAYRVYSKGGEVVEEKIPENRELDIRELYNQDYGY